MLALSTTIAFSQVLLAVATPPKRCASKSALLLLAISLISSLARPAFAQVDIAARRGTFTPGELALLPEYCQDIMFTPGYTGARGDRWRALIGEEFMHMHHYCRGLRDARFAETAQVSRQERRFLWARAVSEYEYVVARSRPSMVLLPEIFVKIGEANLRINRVSAAQEAFERARALKPDYWPAYTVWADRLIELRLYSRARALLEQGLQHAPDEPHLKATLAKIPRNAVRQD